MKDSLQWAYPTLGHQDLCQVNFGTGIAEVLTSFEFFHTRDIAGIAGIAGSAGVRGPQRAAQIGCSSSPAMTGGKKQCRN
jgi:hypothetical protein